jgi:transposase
MGRKKQVGKPAAGVTQAGREPGAPELKAKRHSTPEERRAAVEAFERSGLSQKAFARQWGVSHMTLHKWIHRHRAAGPKGLERLSDGPPKGRGRPPLAEALKAEIVAAKREHPTFGLKSLKAWLWRFVGVQVSRSSVKRVVDAAGLPREAAPKPRRKAKPARRFERSRPGELWQTDITYLDVPWRKRPLYLIAFLDDFSRYVVGWSVSCICSRACTRPRTTRPPSTSTGRSRARRGWGAARACRACRRRASVWSARAVRSTRAGCARRWAGARRPRWGAPCRVRTRSWIAQRSTRQRAPPWSVPRSASRSAVRCCTPGARRCSTRSSASGSRDATSGEGRANGRDRARAAPLELR